MPEYFVISRKKKVNFALPPGWKILQHVKEFGEKPPFSIQTLIKRSFQNPIGPRNLENIISPGFKIAIIVDDLTRPTPKKEILSRLLAMINRKGVPKKNINIIFAVGTHHKVSQGVLKGLLGEIYEGYSVINHDCYSKDLMPIGKLSSGAQVKINPLAVQADIRIGIGSILPHSMNGFSGGGKIIMPGISDFNSIKEHHLVNVVKPSVMSGNTERNPFLEEIFRVARMARLDYIINAVYNLRADVVKIVSGGFIETYKAGVEIGRKNYGIQCEGTADVTITTTFPYDEGPQIIKPLGSAMQMTKKGGTVIMVTGLKEELPKSLLKAFSYVRNHGKQRPENFVLKQLEAGKPILENTPIDFNMGLSLAFLYMSRVRVTVVSKDISERDASQIGFNLAPTVEKAIEVAQRKNPSATVNVLPYGGMILPQFKRNIHPYRGVSTFLSEEGFGL